MDAQKDEKLFCCPPWILIYILLLVGMGIRALYRKIFPKKNEETEGTEKNLANEKMSLTKGKKDGNFNETEDGEVKLWSDLKRVGDGESPIDAASDKWSPEGGAKRWVPK